MAKREPPEFNLTGGLAESRRLLKYATSAGVSATELLARIVRSGGGQMLTTAVRALTVLDAARAEALGVEGDQPDLTRRISRSIK